MSTVEIEAPLAGPVINEDAASFESLIGALIEATEEENIDISGCIACGGCCGRCALPCACDNPWD